MAVTVEKLYEMCEVLDAAKDTVSEKKSEFETILGGTKGGVNEKKLTSQLIVRYFHKFPALRERSLDALFELCEDDDVNVKIRKFVIRNLASLCKESGAHVSKIADVLTQLLQTEDAEEMKIVQAALTQLLNKFTKDTLAAIFLHVLASEEGTELIRERGIKFLALKLKELPATVATKEIQDYIKEKIYEVMKDVSGEEFVLLMHILSSLSSLQTVPGRQSLLELVLKQAELDKPFSAADADRADQIAQCTRQAVPFLSKNVASTPFVVFYLDNVLPVMAAVASADARLELLRGLAEVGAESGALPNPDTQMQTVLSVLMKQLPTPPSLETNGKSENEADKPAEPKVNYSEVEALLITFHALCKRHLDFLGKMPEERETEVKDFRKRLAYVARLIQNYNKGLQTAIKELPKEDLNKEENKLKLTALRTTSNIQTLLKDLLHGNKAHYNSVVRPSWKPLPGGAPASGRKLIGAPDSDGPSPPKRTRVSGEKVQSYYTPPSGKYSANVGAFPERASGGGRGRGRGRRGRF